MFYLSKNLNPQELEQNLILFMIAGYETTSTTLSYCMFVLARHPKEQQKLIEEIDLLLEDVPDVNKKLNFLLFQKGFVW